MINFELNEVHLTPLTELPCIKFYKINENMDKHETYIPHYLGKVTIETLNKFVID